MSASQPYLSRGLYKYSATQLAKTLNLGLKSLSPEETNVICDTAKIKHSRPHATAVLALLRRIPASRVAQHRAYALDTSRANSSRSCIRKGAYC